MSTSGNADCELTVQQKPEERGVHERNSAPMDSPKRKEVNRVTLDPGQGGKLRVICAVLITAAVLVVIATASTLALSNRDTLARRSGSASICERFLMKMKINVPWTQFAAKIATACATE
ncbi:hypothetical protein IV203_028597 [Nitzschia inconspicua]|uniref:Uncharacterized protein n=1 Tax=Nitzschia inconspicua TaxID=303405 RepID=A0A9K3LPW0_9STRA|nr:hypothetical protein IV203_028597 [Nitzschia inconspicua]